jgi:hypothetical protein
LDRCRVLHLPARTDRAGQVCGEVCRRADGGAAGVLQPRFGHDCRRPPDCLLDRGGVLPAPCADLGAAGAWIGVGIFFLSEIVVPITISKANEIWRMEVKKYAVTSIRKNVWFRGHRFISYVSYFNPHDQTISGIAFNLFDQQFRLTRRVDAAKGAFKQEH